MPSAQTTLSCASCWFPVRLPKPRPAYPYSARMTGHADARARARAPVFMQAVSGGSVGARRGAGGNRLIQANLDAHTSNRQARAGRGVRAVHAIAIARRRLFRYYLWAFALHYCCRSLRSSCLNRDACELSPIAYASSNNHTRCA